MTTLKNLKVIAPLTLIYYTMSITLGFLTSYFLSEKEHNFRYPLFITGCQNLIHFLLSQLLCKAKLSLSFLPCALIAAFDIGLSSFSLRKVTLAFFTMVKSSAPVFILLCGFLFGIEKPSIFSFLIMFTIAAGVFLTSKVDTKFDTNGFCLITAASFMAGIRWAYVQLILRTHSKALPTIGGLCLPIAILLLLMSACFEGIQTILKVEFTMDRAFINIGFIVISGCVSFSLLLSEFVLVERTSVVYLSMAGIVKELTIVLVSVIRKEIVLNSVNSIGLVISITGIILFNLGRKFTKDSDEEVKEESVKEEIPLISENIIETAIKDISSINNELTVVAPVVS